MVSNRIKLILLVLLVALGVSLSLLVSEGHRDASQADQRNSPDEGQVSARMPIVAGSGVAGVHRSMLTEAEEDSGTDPAYASDQQYVLGKRFAQAKTAHDAEQILQEIALINQRFASEQIRELNNFCGPDAFTLSSDAVKDKRGAFCQDFSGAHVDGRRDEAVDSIVQSHGFEFEVMSEESLRLVPEVERSDHFSDMVLSTRFAMEIQILIGINVRWKLESGNTLWQIGEELAQDRYPEADLLNAQTVALHLYQCARFGGCGSNNHFTTLFCEIELDGNCNRNATIEDMLFRTTPPVELNLAQEILGKLALMR